MSNPNTPVQPDDHEVRSFRVGPINGGNYELLPQQVKTDIAAVDAGEANENDDNVCVVSGQISQALLNVQTEILQHARRYLLNEGLSLGQVQDAMETLQQEADVELPEVTPELLQEVLIETLDKILFGIKLALEEILINHAKHGNKDPRKMVGGRYWIDEKGELHVVSWDEGEGFVPEGVDDPTEDSKLEIPNGRGRMLSVAFADSFEDGAEGTSGNMGTSVHMTTRLQGLDEVPADEDQPHGISALAKHVKTAAKQVLDAKDNTEKQRQKDKEQREKQARIRKSWWGLRHKVIRILGGV
jgi:anti-sigma regulatory factor (Ser/Thr protein kinase)